MHLRLERYIFNSDCTIGRLYQSSVAGACSADDEFLCYVLEDVDRKLEIQPSRKSAGETAIPRGSYKIEATYSNRFHRCLPQLLEVPQYTGVRIHPGNTKADTEGCLLPGLSVATDQKSVLQSKAAFDKVFALIQSSKTPVRIEIV